MVNIYALIDPRTEEIRYVGKTKKDLSYRLKSHIYKLRTATEQCHRANWIRSLLKQNLLPEIRLLEEVSSEDWQWEERWWIAYGKTQGWKLTNSTIGGEGVIGHNLSLEHRAKISRRQKGKVISAETKARISAALSGKKHSEDRIKKMSEAKKGNTYFLGKKHSDEARRKISESKRGEKARTVKLTETDVREIRQLLPTQSTYKIAKQFGVCQTTICEIKSGRNWSWLV